MLLAIGNTPICRWGTTGTPPFRLGRGAHTEHIEEVHKNRSLATAMSAIALYMSANDSPGHG